MTQVDHIFLSDNPEQTAHIGADIARLLRFPSCVYLNGDLGAGKTTLTKSIIKTLGYIGDVTSPTYNLIQEYEVGQGMIYHMDLYRLDDPSELEFLALGDLWSDSSMFLIEWPEKGDNFLPRADYEISLEKIFDLSVEQRKIVLKKY